MQEDLIAYIFPILSGLAIKANRDYKPMKQSLGNGKSKLDSLKTRCSRDVGDAPRKQSFPFM